MKHSKIIHSLKCLIFVAFAAILFVACSSPTTENSPPVNRDLVKPPIDPPNVAEVPQVENTAEQINKENFDKIKNGMSLFDVQVLIAGDDKKVTSVKQNGVLKETYRWETVDGNRYIEVLFEDEKVVGKNQKGLK